MAKHILTPRDGPVIAIDPGLESSGWVSILGAGKITSEIVENAKLLDTVRSTDPNTVTFVIERMNFMAKHAGNSVHEPNVWAGRFMEAFEGRGGSVHRIFRRTVATHIAGQVAEGNATIRAAIIDRYGGKDKAIGGVRCKTCKGKGWTGRDHDYCQSCFGRGWSHPRGPLYGVVTHCWQALALALAYRDGAELAND